MKTSFNDFEKYWFTHKDPYKVEVYDKSTLKLLQTCNKVDFCSGVITDPQMFADYELYTHRPEYSVGDPIDSIIDFSDPMNNAYETLKTTYNNLLTGIFCLRAFQSGNTVERGEQIAEKVIKYLESTDFYDAPASTVYHESVSCGLVFHSLKVYNEACMLQKLPPFTSINICKWALVALVHDWCKIGLYESYLKNVKNEYTGAWEKVPSFKVATVKRNNTLGHGAASMFMISQFVRLALDEALAIRWHMGTWNVCDGEINDLQDSNETYPLVHMLQFADQLAITRYESERYRRNREAKSIE